MCQANRPRNTRGEDSRGGRLLWIVFLSFFWLLVWAFVLGCYLVVLFQIVVDLFRDENLSGWWKALWIIFLIIVPFLSALIYVIARGRGMAERHAAAKGPRELEPYVPPPIIHMSDPDRSDRLSSDAARPGCDHSGRV